MALIDNKVPDIGDFKDVAVIELLVSPGDSVKPEQSLISVESDKASMEIPSSHAGVVKEVKVKVGDVVNEGSVIISLEVEGAVNAASPEPPPALTRERAMPPPPYPRSSPSPDTARAATPSASAHTGATDAGQPTYSNRAAAQM